MTLFSLQICLIFVSPLISSFNFYIFLYLKKWKHSWLVSQFPLYSTVIQLYTYTWICMFVYMYIQILFYYRLLQDVG